MPFNRLSIPIILATGLLGAGFAREMSARAPASPVASQAADSQRLSVLVDLAGTRARIAELDRQIKQCQAELQTKLKNDPVAAEIQKIIDPLQKSADRKHSSPDSYSPPDIEQADMAVATQRARLFERQEQFGDDAPLLMQLKHDRITAATQLAELEAQAHVIANVDRAEQTTQASLR